jgi:hypothetical protein
VTGDDGTYFVTALHAGTLHAGRRVAGFKKYSRSGIRLDLGRTTTLDLPLESRRPDGDGDGHRGHDRWWT